MALFLLIALLLGVGEASAAVVKEAQSQGTCAGCTTLTVPHTVGTGSERFLKVDVPWLHNGSKFITGVTYGGVALSYVGTTGNGGCLGYTCEVQTWKMVAPPSGTADIVVSSTGNYELSVLGSSYTGVDQTAPHGTLAPATGSGPTPSVAVTSDSTQVVAGALIMSASGGSPTVSGGATQIANLLGGAGFTYGAASYVTGAPSLAYEWSYSSQPWAISALPLNPSTGGGGGGGGGITFFTELLRWTDNDTAESLFRLQWKHATQPSYADLATFGANTQQYTVQFTTETARCYRVRSENSGGVSPYSNELCSAVAAAGPIRPTLSAPPSGGGLGDD